MIEGKDLEETIELTAEALGISEQQAAFIIAIETGEITGDMIELDENGNPVPPESEQS